MVTEHEIIKKYMQEKIDDDEVFLLLELKGDSGKKDFKEYSYYCKGESRIVLMALAEIVEREAKQMGLTFDETIEVMKHMHIINTGHYRARKLNRMAKEWKVIDF